MARLSECLGLKASCQGKDCIECGEVIGVFYTEYLIWRGEASGVLESLRVGMLLECWGLKGGEKGKGFCEAGNWANGSGPWVEPKEGPGKTISGRTRKGTNRNVLIC